MKLYYIGFYGVGKITGDSINPIHYFSEAEDAKKAVDYLNLTNGKAVFAITKPYDIDQVSPILVVYDSLKETHPFVAINFPNKNTYQKGMQNLNQTIKDKVCKHKYYKIPSFYEVISSFHYDGYSFGKYSNEKLAKESIKQNDFSTGFVNFHPERVFEVNTSFDTWKQKMETKTIKDSSANFSL